MEVEAPAALPGVNGSENACRTPDPAAAPPCSPVKEIAAAAAAAEATANGNGHV